MVDYLVLRYMNESLNHVINVMEEPTMETGRDALPTRYNITFENVSFGYLDKLTVQDLSFTVPEKSMLALVGHSGSGKTTIASLMSIQEASKLNFISVAFLNGGTGIKCTEASGCD